MRIGFHHHAALLSIEVLMISGAYTHGTSVELSIYDLVVT